MDDDDVTPTAVWKGIIARSIQSLRRGNSTVVTRRCRWEERLLCLALLRTLWLRGALHIFPSFSTPEGERHTKKANHPTSSENTPMYKHKQSEHTRHASLFYVFDSHTTHACTLQPAALVFVSYGFVLVRVRVLSYAVYHMIPP